MIGIIIYAIGFVLAYILSKKIRNKNEPTTWGNVRTSLGLGILSWLTLFVILGFFMEKHIKDPPKWL